ncbi:sulfite exporter TauE/SafE family protein, partial [bacterium]|nr:sulfite exporter TauE/SafE family protein [bacterium]
MRGFAGFGSAMVTAPVFAILFGPVETVAVIILMEIVVTVQLMPGILGDVEWRFVGPMAAAAALFMPLGSWLLVSMDPGLMARAMAAIVVAFAVVLMTGWRYRGERRHLPTMVVGAVSGVMVAATTLGIPPVMLYMLSGRDTAVRNRANVIGYFAVTLTVLIALMIANLEFDWFTWRTCSIFIVLWLVLNFVWDMLMPEGSGDPKSPVSKNRLFLFKRMHCSNWRFATFLLIMSGFWTSFNQIFLTMPLYIRDF